VGEVEPGAASLLARAAELLEKGSVSEEGAEDGAGAITGAGAAAGGGRREQLVEIVREMALLQRWLAAGAEATGGAEAGGDAAGGGASAAAASGAVAAGGAEAEAASGAVPLEAARRRRRVRFSTHDASHLQLVGYATPNPNS